MAESKIKGFKIGKREKIIIGFLGMLVFLTVIHFVLYYPKSKEINKVNEEYNAAKAQFSEYASKNLSEKELEKIRVQVEGMDQTLDSAISKFRIGKELEFANVTGPDFEKIIDDISQKEKTLTKPKITILSGWKITDDIPGLDPAQIPDILNQAKDKKDLMSMISNDSTDPKAFSLRANFDNQFNDVMKRLNLGKTDLENLPDFVAWLKKLKVYVYVNKYRENSKIKSEGELFGLLDINIPNIQWLYQGMFFLQRSQEIINIGINSQLDSISELTLLDTKDVRPAVKVVATPTPQGGRGGMMEDMMMMMGDPMGGGRRGGGPMGMFGGFMGMATPTPTVPAEPPVAFSTPLKVTITGTNSAVMKFLYGVTHSPNMMDIQDMDLTLNDDGSIKAIVTINCYREVRTVNEYIKTTAKVKK